VPSLICWIASPQIGALIAAATCKRAMCGGETRVSALLCLVFVTEA